MNADRNNIIKHALGEANVVSRYSHDARETRARDRTLRRIRHVRMTPPPPPPPQAATAHFRIRHVRSDAFGAGPARPRVYVRFLRSPVPVPYTPPRASPPTPPSQPTHVLRRALPRRALATTHTDAGPMLFRFVKTRKHRRPERARTPRCRRR